MGNKVEFYSCLDPRKRGNILLLLACIDLCTWVTRIEALSNIFVILYLVDLASTYIGNGV